MSRRIAVNIRAWIVLASLVTLAGCGDRIDLDKSVILQMIALDVGEHQPIQAYFSAPTFLNTDRGRGSEIIFSKSGSSLRQLRRVISTSSAGAILSGKIQVLLVTDRFLAVRDLFEEMNVFYRDPINPNDAILIYTKSPLAEIVKINNRLSPMLSSYMHDLITKSHEQGLSVMTTLERYNYMHYNRGMTPTLSEIRVSGKQLENVGSVLLSQDGRRQGSLNVKQTSLLLMLQNEASFPLNINMKHDGQAVSFDIMKAKVKIGTDYREGAFHYTIDMPMTVSLTEYASDQPFSEVQQELVQAIQAKLKGDCEKLIQLFQDKRVDPVGFGMHARAYRYAEFRKVQDDWPGRFAEAKVEVRPVVHVKQFGIVK